MTLLVPSARTAALLTVLPYRSTLWPIAAASTDTSKLAPMAPRMFPTKIAAAEMPRWSPPETMALPGPSTLFPAARRAIAILLSPLLQTTPYISAGTAATVIPWWRFLMTTAPPGQTSLTLEQHSESRTLRSLPWLQATATAQLSP